MANQSEVTRGQADGGGPRPAIADDQMRHLRYVHNASQRVGAGRTGVLLEKLRRAPRSQRLSAIKQFHATCRIFCIVAPTVSVY